MHSELTSEPASSTKKRNMGAGNRDAFLKYLDPAEAKRGQHNIEAKNLNSSLKYT
jgi:hypothetical protein